jgi:hypothetical protein
MEILVLSTVLPHGRASGGEIATHAVVDALEAAGHRVTVLGYRRRGETRDAPRGWVEVGERSIETDEAGRAQVATWLGSAFARRLPYSAAKFRSRPYRRAAWARLSSGKFHLAVVDHAQMGWLVPMLERTGTPHVLLAENVETLLYARRAKGSRGLGRALYRREERLVGRLEERLARRARAVWALGPSDATHFRRFGAALVLPLPSHFDPPAAPVEKRRDIALLGTWTWDESRAALEWFLDQVAPRLPAGLTVEVAGRGGEWIDGSHPEVRYCGFVPDALEFLSGARVVAVPGAGATGVQVKTLDAIASGACVVASPPALRDLPDPPSSVRVAATPEEFAQGLRELAAAPEALTPQRAGIEWSEERRQRFTAVVAEAARSAGGAS